MTNEFRPRTGKGNYIKKRGDRYYYRRVIPPKQRHLFHGKTEWNIPLEGRTNSERIAEAQSYAHEHNRELEFGPGARMLLNVDVNPPYIENGPSYCIDYTHLSELIGRETRPFRVRRDGRTIETYKVAISTDPEYLRRVEKDGFIGMSLEEAESQVALNKLLLADMNMANADQEELTSLRTERVERQIDDLEIHRGETLSSALPKWHAHSNPTHQTKAAHQRRVQVFIDLHGDMALTAITKRHVVEFVRHLQTMAYRKKPLTAKTIEQYLASVGALLNYAAKSDMIPFNPSKGVEPPRDTRPKSARTRKPFAKGEIRNLIETSTKIWTNRRVLSNTPLTRKNDLITALHMLTWTGARPEEVCQLRLVDIDLQWQVIGITNDDTEDEECDLRPRSLKNENSVRSVPIHSKLVPVIRQHIEYLRSVSNGPLLFPSFQPALETGRYARPISSEWSNTLRKHISPDPQKVLYSLRHSWSAESKRSGMPEYVREALMGHGGDNPTGDLYGSNAEWIEAKRRYVEAMDCINGEDF